MTRQTIVCLFVIGRIDGREKQMIRRKKFAFASGIFSIGMPNRIDRFQMNISDNNINSIADNIDEQSWQEVDRECIAEHRNLCTDICQSSMIFILLIFIAILPSKSIQN